MGEVHSRYPISVRWTGDRDGLVSSPDGLPELVAGPPPQFEGRGGRWSPEHLLVAAVASCWETTFAGIAANSKLELRALELAAEGFVERGEDRRFRFARIALRPRIEIAREEDRAKALRIAEKAHDACLVSRSLTAEVTLEPEISIAAVG